jgi:hypothetical protein
MPFPPQGAAVPIHFGVAPMGRNIERIGELGDGWLPMERDPEKLKAPIEKIRKSMAAHGRDPSKLEVRASYRLVNGEGGKPDLEATLAQTEAYLAVGVTVLRVEPGVFCRTREDFEPFLKRVLEEKKKG